MSSLFSVEVRNLLQRGPAPDGLERLCQMYEQWAIGEFRDFCDSIDVDLYERLFAGENGAKLADFQRRLLLQASRSTVTMTVPEKVSKL